MYAHIQIEILHYLYRVDGVGAYGLMIARDIYSTSGPVSYALRSLVSQGYVSLDRVEKVKHGGIPRKWYRLTLAGRDFVMKDTAHVFTHFRTPTVP